MEAAVAQVEPLLHKEVVAVAPRQGQAAAAAREAPRDSLMQLKGAAAAAPMAAALVVVPLTHLELATPAEVMEAPAAFSHLAE